MTVRPPIAACMQPDAADQHAQYGMRLLSENRCAEALAALRTAVALGNRTGPCLLNLALAEQQSGDPNRAQTIMEALEDAAPAWDEPPLRLAERHRAGGASEMAEAAYRRVLERNPHRPEALIGLAVLLIGRGAAEPAQTLLLRCCGVDPGRAEAWDALGLALTMTGDAAAAESAFAEAQRLAPQSIGFALHRAEAAIAAGTTDAELARLELASLDDPLNVATLTAWGYLLERLGRLAAAADPLEAAAALAPDCIPAIPLLGSVLAGLHRLPEAHATLRRAVSLKPDDPVVINNLAAVLIRMHRMPEARRLLAELIAQHGPALGPLCNLANATLSVGLQDEAEALARQALDLFPGSVMAWRTLCNTLPYRETITGAELTRTLRSCSDHLPRAAAHVFTNDPDPDRRLRLGLLSGTLKVHPVGWLTVAGFETLDPNRFDIICLSNVMADDAISRRFRAVATEWHDIAGLTDAAVAERARALCLDIVIDLGGYGDAARMPACAHRLAPVQVKWVGMQNHSTGLAEMDWFISDQWETPPELDALYTERLLRLPDGYVCYSPPLHAPEVGPLPALENGFITFGCFNNLAKITPRVIETWAEILRRMPRARLMLKAHPLADRDVAERFVTAFAAHGVDTDRLVLEGPSRHRGLLAAYNRVDLVLDPFPYSGGLTTCEALWMGVPTVTMPGETFASRHSTSHMSNVDLADWVATTPAAYVERALVKAANPLALSVLRAGLRDRVKASPLCDAPRFGRHLGDALRFAWQHWSADQRADRSVSTNEAA